MTAPNPPDPPPGSGVSPAEQERARERFRKATSPAFRDLVDAEPVGEEPTGEDRRV